MNTQKQSAMAVPGIAVQTGLRGGTVCFMNTGECFENDDPRVAMGPMREDSPPPGLDLSALRNLGRVEGIEVLTFGEESGEPRVLRGKLTGNLW